MPEHPDALLEPAQVLTYLRDSDVRLLHVTNDAEEYAREHLAGAVHAEGYGDFTEERGGVRALVPTRERMAETLGRLGVSPEQRVICYAAGRSPWPARAYWVLRYFGFTRVHVVNGDLRRLAAAGAPTEQGPAAGVASAPPALPEGDRSLLALVDDVLAVSEGRPGTVVDCRSDDEWHGRAGGAATPARLGRVPRAVHLNWELLVDEGGRFLRTEQLRAIYAACGVDGTQPVYPYCGGGVRSAVSWLVLHELLGYELARNYDGSWSEWAGRDDLPVERD